MDEMHLNLHSTHWRQLVPRNLLLLLAILTTRHAAAANLADFMDYSLAGPSGGVALPGRLFVPPEAISDPATPRPLIVFLHGGGASGTNNITQVDHTPDYLLDEAKRRAAYLYVPQTANNWSSTSVIDNVMTMIDRAVTEKNADFNRLYATGYSNGGGGTWNLASRHMGRFAAAMPVSGVATAAGFNAANLVDTPIFAIHARDDATVSVARSRTVVNGILAAAGETLPTYPAAASPLYMLVSNPQIEFHREFAASAPPGSMSNFFISRSDLDLLYFETAIGGHTGPVGAYFSPVVYDWMFSHTLLVPESGTLLLTSTGLLLRVLSRRRRAA
jgi:predicted esterase